MKRFLMVLAITLTGGSLQAEQQPSSQPGHEKPPESDSAFFQAIGESNDPQDYKEFLELFPDSQLEKVARRRLARAEVFVKCENLIDEHGDKAMHVAMKDDNVDVLKCLKEHGIPIDTRIYYDEETAMHFAALNNAVDAMKWLKAQGSDINVPNRYNKTPIHYAAEHNAVAAMKWLKMQGADINASIHYRNPGPIRNWNDTGDWFKAQMAHFNATNNNYTPMHFAAVNNAVDAMKWLETQGVDINTRNHEGTTPMHRAAATRNDNRDAMEWLQAQDVDVNVRDNNGRTPIHVAASFEKLDALNWLETQGADIDARDHAGNTPMHVAADNNAIEAMKWFRARGTKINIRNKAGETPLHRAVTGAAKYLTLQNDLPATSNKDMIEAEKSQTTKIENTIAWLMEQETDINAQDENGHTPVHLAAQNNAADILNLFRSQNININMLDNQGRTAIHLAAQNNAMDALDALDALKLLQPQNIIINMTDHQGQTPMHLAAACKKKGSSIDTMDAMEWLKAHGANVNTRDGDGNTPLHLAASCEKRDSSEKISSDPEYYEMISDAMNVMKWLHAHGADIEPRNAIGETPMDIAVQIDDISMIKWLEKASAPIGWTHGIKSRKWFEGFYWIGSEDYGIDYSCMFSNHTNIDFMADGVYDGNGKNVITVDGVELNTDFMKYGKYNLRFGKTTFSTDNLSYYEGHNAENNALVNALAGGAEAVWTTPSGDRFTFDLTGSAKIRNCLLKR